MSKVLVIVTGLVILSSCITPTSRDRGPLSDAIGKSRDDYPDSRDVPDAKMPEDEFENPLWKEHQQREREREDEARIQREERQVSSFQDTENEHVYLAARGGSAFFGGPDFDALFDAEVLLGYGIPVADVLFFVGMKALTPKTGSAIRDSVGNRETIIKAGLELRGNLSRNSMVFSPYLLAQAGGVLMHWSLDNSLEAVQRISYDIVGGLMFGAGAGIDLVRTKSFRLGSAVIAEIHLFFNRTWQGFYNDAFGDYKSVRWVFEAGWKATYSATAGSRPAAAPSAAEKTATHRPPSPGVMVLLEGGSFTMGDVSGSGGLDELPSRGVFISSFYMGKTEVTQAEFRQRMGFNPSRFPGDNLPVEEVTWFDAAAYCNEKSRRAGFRKVYTMNDIVKNPDGNIVSADVTADWKANGYRLPTEAEWEYAAKGGKRSLGWKYSGGDNLNYIARHRGNSGGGTGHVGTGIANELGLKDLSGNVSEWCWDWYGGYDQYAQRNPRGSPAGLRRVVRGGSWDSDESILRAGSRDSMEPEGKAGTLGFRIVRSAWP